jgi:hypothetical protein
VIFVVTLVCGLAMAFGPQAGKMAFFINLWMMIALSLSSVLYAPINLALGFSCGSASVAVLLLLAKTDRVDEGVSPANTALHWSLAPLRAHLNLRSPIMHFALSRVLVAAFAMWLGWRLALAHPFWIAVTFLIVVVPDRQQAARTSWQRAIGTVIGVAVGALVLAFPLQPITLLLWLLVILLMLAVQNVNYVLYIYLRTDPQSDPVLSSPGSRRLVQRRGAALYYAARHRSCAGHHRAVGISREAVQHRASRRVKGTASPPLHIPALHYSMRMV